MSNWIKFKSDVQPVPDGVKVTIKTVDGHIRTGAAECFDWGFTGYGFDIVAFRVEDSPQAESTSRELSAREYAAIKLRVPDSGTDWLDVMISKSLRDEFAGKAMQGIMSSWGQHDVTDFEEIASDSKNLANAMLKASKGE